MNRRKQIILKVLRRSHHCSAYYAMKHMKWIWELRSYFAKLQESSVMAKRLVGWGYSFSPEELAIVYRAVRKGNFEYFTYFEKGEYVPSQRDVEKIAGWFPEKILEVQRPAIGWVRDGTLRKDGYGQRRCGQLLDFLRRVAGRYNLITGKSFNELCLPGKIRQAGDNVLLEAIRELKQTSPQQYGWYNVDVKRTWQKMTLADIEVFANCLKCSLQDEFLLVHYDDTVMWGNSALQGIEDVWEAYGGLLQECRSAVINLSTWKYALLPFSKFRNLNEAPAYSVDAIKKRIEDAADGKVEFSEKLDGSFMQMRYIADPRFQDGIIISSSGSLALEKSRQLADVLRFMKNRATGIRRMVTENPGITFIFEWISPNDTHVVSYRKEMHGLHLVGMRRLEDGYLFPYSFVIKTAEQFAVPSTSLYSVTLEEVLDTIAQLKGMEQEGYVLYIDEFLVKIKCPDFLNMIHSVEASRSFNNIVKYAADGKSDDFISMLPECYQEEARAKLRKLMAYERDVLHYVEAEYGSIPKNADKKTAMVAINKISNRFIRELVRAKYFGQPLEIIVRKRGDSLKYVKESDIDAFYQNLGK